MHSLRWRWAMALATVAALAVAGTGLAGATQATPTTGFGGSGGSALAFTYELPGAAVFPEGIAYDPASGDAFVGSSADGTIFRVGVGSRAVQTFSAPGADGRKSALGMKVDARGRLVVAGGGTGLIFVYDTTSGTLLARFDTGLAPKTFLNDVAIAPNGDAYVTDSTNPVLFRIPAPALGGVRETFAAASPAASPPALVTGVERFVDFTGSALTYQNGINANGIAVTPDGAALIVVQTNTGQLFRIEIATKAVTAIDLGGASVKNGDGILLEGRTLYVVRNQDRLIVPVQLAADFARGTVGAGFTDPTFDFPTTIARAGDRLLVVNSQFENSQNPKPPFTVSNVPIPAVAGTPGA